MVAFPFIQHPKFSEYVDFAKTVGCTVDSFDDSDTDNPVTIFQRNGLYAMVSFDSNEVLSLDAISHLDRRLSIKSPWLEM